MLDIPQIQGENTSIFHPFMFILTFFPHVVC